MFFVLTFLERVVLNKEKYENQYCMKILQHNPFSPNSFHPTNIKLTLLCTHAD